MSNSITEADLDAVNADLLPPQARQLVRLIGMPHTLTLLEKRGGMTLRIPIDPDKCVVLKAILPMEAIAKLCAEMPGKRLELPKIDKIVKQIRNLAINNERKLFSAPAVAQRHGLSRRQVINISKDQKDNRQRDLLDDFNLS